MALSDNLVQSIRSFRRSVAALLPAVQEEVNDMIRRKEKNNNAIEHRLDMLLSLCSAGMGDDLFNRLLEYYRTVNPEAAAHYHSFYQEMNE